MVPYGNYKSPRPSVHIQRTIFDKSHDHKTTFNSGDLVPIMVEEVLPGSTYSVDLSALVRQQTQIVPVMGNAYCEVHAFFVPTRLIWEHTKEFYGEVDPSSVLSAPAYSIPQVKFPDSTGFGLGSLADHMGVQPNLYNGTGPTATKISINALPFRAYCEIWNYYYRDQNTMQPAYVPKGDTLVTGESFSRSSAVSSPPTVATRALSAYKGGYLLPVCRARDYFSTCAPWPQKGNPVTVNSSVVGALYSPVAVGANFKATGTSISSLPNINSNLTSDQAVFTGSNMKEDGTTYVDTWAELRGQFAGLGTVNDIRMAFAAQRMLEKDLYGTRFEEYLKNHFGTEVGDSRVQIPEYLGGSAFRLNSQQVVQTSSTDSETPQGNLAAYSLSTDTAHLFTKSFTEPGYLILCAHVRVQHCYATGIDKMWTRKDKLDFYDPAMAMIGNMPVYKRELATVAGSLDKWDQIFGYQEAWADYRFHKNEATGMFRPSSTGSYDSLAYWLYADEYSTLPSLSPDWLAESPNLIDNTLALNYSEVDQILADFYFQVKATLPMPMYSVPGLIDHL